MSAPLSHCSVNISIAADKRIAKLLHERTNPSPEAQACGFLRAPQAVHDQWNNFVFSQKLDRFGRESKQQDGAENNVIERVRRSCQLQQWHDQLIFCQLDTSYRELAQHPCAGRPKTQQYGQTRHWRIL
jgi:hypothetical protein